MQQIKVEIAGQRLDVFLTEYFSGKHTRSQITGSIKSGRTTLNGNTVKGGTCLRIGDIINANIETNEMTATPENIDIDIVFEDEHLMIINKPRGMVVHPGAGNRSGTLLNGLLSLNGNDDKTLDRAGIVHRLDKNTAGLMVVAKTSKAQSQLSAMFERHEINRTYIGLVEGKMPREQGTINANIIRDPSHRTLFKTTTSGGRSAITHYKVLQTFPKWSLVQFNLETGRTHQIRVHCKSIGHLLVGDVEYNPNSSIKVDGQLLESVEISFTHPITHKTIHHKIQPSQLFADTIKRIS